MLRDGAEENVQLCVYVDDKCVVDLYGTAIGTVYILVVSQLLFSFSTYLVLLVPL